MAYINVYPNETATGTPVDITSLALVDNVRRPRASVESVFSGDGSSTVHLQSRLTRPVITMDAWVEGTPSERRDKLAALMGAVSFTTPRAMKFEDDGQWYYTVVPQGAREVDDYTDSSCVHLSFESVYPWQWGTRFDVTQAQAQAGINVPGNMPATMVIPYASTTAWAVTTDSSGAWGLTVNNGTGNPTYHFKISGNAASTQYKPEVDTLRQHSELSLVPKAPDARSDGYVWPLFHDGATVAVTGSMTKMTICPRRV